MKQRRTDSLVRAALFGAVLVISALGALAPPALAKQAYLRSPDIHGDRIVFAAEGDLWTAGTDGRDVRHLTSHVGDEGAAAYSPDGEWIAFTGDYDGNSDLFVIPAGGGEPKRLTWHPGPDICVGWKPDGSAVFFLSWRESPHRTPLLFEVPASGGEPKALPLGMVAHFDADPAGGRYAFTRSAGGGTWKRYRGGTAADIWVGDPKKADYRQVTDFEGADMFPMWRGGRIWFLSDPGGTMNIWSMNPDGSDRQRHTTFDTWDARNPGMGPSGKIAFTLAGDVHLFDPATGEERAVPIDLPSEFTLTRKRYPDASDYITWFTLSQEGDRLAVIARGEIFSVPVEEGVTLPVTHGSGARERGAGFGPEGKRLVYITDGSGEERLVTADSWGRGSEKEVGKADTSRWMFPPHWSPDGEWIAYADEDQRLFVVKAEGGTPREVDRGGNGEIDDYTWSPDGRWLAYSKVNDIELGSVFIYDVKEDEIHRVTGWSTDDGSPAWDPDGRYLYFLGDRVMNPLIGTRDFETVEYATTKPYMLLLRPDVENPLVPTEGIPPEEGDEKKKDEKKKDKEKGKKDGDDDEDEEEKKPEPVEIDFDGLADRWIELPVKAGRYVGLGATSDKLFYLSLPMTGLAEDRGSDDDDGPRGTLMAFDFEEKEADTFVSGVSSFEVRAGADKIAFMKKGGSLYVTDTGSAPKDLSDSEVDLSGMIVELDPMEEWRQIYFEAWRNQRDFYWDAGMHGVDWDAVRDQYAALLPRLATRSDLRDLIAEMIGELATSHTYVWGGDAGRRVPRLSTGLLGAVFEREKDAFRVVKIYRADAADRVRSPLLEPGVNVKEGDYIVAVNGLSFPKDEPILASLENLAGKEVLLTVNDKPSADGGRSVVVEPLGTRSEGGLIYADWVRKNREYVAAKTDGKIGYIHVPDMGGWGLSQFDRWFYPQLDKEGMVVDMRWNGGGFVSQLIVSRLGREPIMFGRARGGDTWTYPDKVINGPFVVLTNQFAGSDGDIGPRAIQLAGLAPVIGKRSWGGVVGIRGDKPLVDGGMLTQPEYAYWEPPRGWGMENRGVDPDIPLDNLPQDLGRGVDAQLDRGIEEVMRLHSERPPVHPDFEPAPDRSRGSYRDEL
ncbi:MAG: S41 family peptidase [Candidatus Eisenbacteria bacterium]